MRCPRCGSEHVQYATKTTGGGFSFLDSCCGYIMLGPLGLLCGACGSGTSTQEFWICHDCGHKFSAASAQEKAREEANLAEEYQKNRAQLAAAGNRSHDELQADLEQAGTARRAAEEAYRQCLETCIAGNSPELKKCAGVLKRDHTGLAWLIMIVGTGIAFGGAILGAIPALLSLVYLIIYHKRSKRAKAVLAEQYPGFSDLEQALQAAQAREQELENLVRLHKKTKKYEQTHPKE